MELAKVSRNAENMAGITMGSVTLRMIFMRLALSSIAASSRFASIFCKIPPIRM